MANTRAEAFAPATVANLGVGFDILGLAVDGAGDTVIATLREQPGAIITQIEGDDGKLSDAARKNVATIAANALLKATDAQHGVSLFLRKGLPLASGLGSSAASSVAAAVAVNALLNEPFRREDLLPFVLEGEAAVSGYHADNVAPCLLGGIVLNNGTAIDDIHKLPVPDNLYLALVTPDVAVPTAEARAVLPEQVSLKTMIHQTGAVAALVAALYRGDVKAVAAAMETDEVIEPARAHLMPYLTAVRAAAKSAGALAVVISGAGPTLCAVCDDLSIAQGVAQTMANVYNNAAIHSRTQHCRVLQDGARILSVE